MYKYPNRLECFEKRILLIHIVYLLDKHNKITNLCRQQYPGTILSTATKQNHNKYSPGKQNINTFSAFVQIKTLNFDLVTSDYKYGTWSNLVYKYLRFSRLLHGQLLAN